VQQYMVLALVSLAVFTAVLYFVVLGGLP
jgi:hypothetical protein